MELNEIKSAALSAAAIEQSARAPASGRESNIAGSTVGAERPALESDVDSQRVFDTIRVQQELPPKTRLYVDESSKRIVAQLLDENGEVVRQLPPQALLDISERFNRLEGLLFDEQR